MSTVAERPDLRPAPPGSARRGPSAWLVVAVLTVVATALRVPLLGQTLFGDELSTWWLVSAHDLPGMVGEIRDTIEITPPLSFVLSWLTTRIDLTPELLRAPALLAGVATVPLVFVLGARTVGRLPGVVAAAFVTFAPFLVFYSSEARNYQVTILLTLLSTLALLSAVEDGRARWWIAYGACSCLAMYSHYTAAFYLGPQVLWALWAHPASWRPLLAANGVAALAFLPWLPGLRNDLDSPDRALMYQLTPFTPHQVRLDLEHWSVGYPFVQSTTELRDLPGIPGLALMALGLATALVVAARRLRAGARPGRRVLLVAVLLLGVPLGQAAVSLVSSPLFNARNLAVAWPPFALCLAALLLAAGPKLRLVTVGFVLVGFVVGGVKMLDADYQRPDVGAAAAVVNEEFRPGDAVLDAAILFFSPGPVTPLDQQLRPPLRTLRVGAADRRDGNFRPIDPVPPTPEVVRRATARGGRVFLVTPEPAGARGDALWNIVFADAPRPYRLLERRQFPGYIPVALLTYGPAG